MRTAVLIWDIVYPLFFGIMIFGFPEVLLDAYQVQVKGWGSWTAVGTREHLAYIFFRMLGIMDIGFASLGLYSLVYHDAKFQTAVMRIWVTISAMSLYLHLQHAKPFLEAISQNNPAIMVNTVLYAGTIAINLIASFMPAASGDKKKSK